MAVTRADKDAELEQLEKAFRGSDSAILVDYKGMNVPQVTELRRQLRTAKASYKVVKNTLARRALKGTSFESLDEHFQGSGNLDRDGTRRMLTATFLRFQNIKLIAMSSQARVDPQTPTLGRVEAQVLVTGAQGLIPERAEPYTVRMEWRLVGGDWKLADLRWDE